MTDLAEHAALAAAEARARIADRRAQHNARITGLAALAPDLGQLAATVRPAVDAAVAAFLAAGIATDLVEEWTNDRKENNRASLTITCRAGQGWDPSVARACGQTVRFAVHERAVTVSVRPGGNAKACFVPINAGSEELVDAGLRCALESFLSAAEDASVPVQRGAEVRGYGVRSGSSGGEQSN